MPLLHSVTTGGIFKVIFQRVIHSDTQTWSVRLGCWGNHGIRAAQSSWSAPRPPSALLPAGPQRRALGARFCAGTWGKALPPSQSRTAGGALHLYLKEGLGHSPPPLLSPETARPASSAPRLRPPSHLTRSLPAQKRGDWPHLVRSACPQKYARGRRETSPRNRLPVARRGARRPHLHTVAARWGSTARDAP